MNEVENAVARAQAAEAASRASMSPNRARLWAGLNRYLAAESEHQHKAAKAEREAAEAAESEESEESEPDETDETDESR